MAAFHFASIRCLGSAAIAALYMAGCAEETTQPPADHANAANHAEQIAAVEIGLAPPFLPTGAVRPNWSLEERLTYHKTPGLSLAIVEDGELAWSKTYGFADVAEGISVESATRFQAASVSKPVAAIGALRLVQEGKLSLDAPVNDYLTSWKIPDNEFTEAAPVTLRHLLSHTGGLTVHGFPGYAADEVLPSAVQVLNGESPTNTAAIVVNKQPGESYRYSGGGYTILQVLMEDVTGEAFPALMDRLVFTPFEMTNSSYEQPLPDLTAPNASVAYDWSGEAVPGHSHRYPEMAAAGLWTTAEDLMKLMLAVTGKGNGDAPALSAELMRELQTPPADGTYGLGFRVIESDDRTVLQHGGSNQGFRALWYFDVTGRYGAAMMTNGSHGQAIRREVTSALADVYGWPFGATEFRKIAELTDEERAAFVGRYKTDDDRVTSEIVVSIVGDGLIIENDPYIIRTTLYMNKDRSGLFTQGKLEIGILYNEDASLRGLNVFGVDFAKQ